MRMADADDGLMLGQHVQHVQQQVSILGQQGGKPPLPLALLFGDDVKAANVGYFAEQQRAQRAGAASSTVRGLSRFARPAAIDGRARIAFGEWRTSALVASVAWRQAARLLARRERRCTLRRHVRGWATVTVGANAVDAVARQRAALEQQESLHAVAQARFAEQLAAKQATEQAVEHRAIYRRGMERGYEAASTVQEAKLREAWVQVDELRATRAAELTAAVTEAVAAVEQARLVAVAAALEAELQRAAALELRAASSWSAGHLRRALAAWAGIVGTRCAARAQATRALAAASCGWALRAVLPAWAACAHRRASQRSAAVECRSRCCLRVALRALSTAARQSTAAARHVQHVALVRDRSTLLVTFCSWRQRADRGIAVLEMRTRGLARQQHAVALAAFLGWSKLAASTRMNAAQDWRRQRLLVAFTAWSVAADGAVSERALVGARVQEEYWLDRRASAGGAGQIGSLLPARAEATAAAAADDAALAAQGGANYSGINVMSDGCSDAESVDTGKSPSFATCASNGAEGSDCEQERTRRASVDLDGSGCEQEQISMPAEVDFALK